MRETFIVKIQSAQNATWQGAVTWADSQKTECFRSALELIRLIDSAVEQKENPENPEDRTRWRE